MDDKTVQSSSSLEKEEKYREDYLNSEKSALMAYIVQKRIQEENIKNISLGNQSQIDHNNFISFMVNYFVRIFYTSIKCCRDGMVLINLEPLDSNYDQFLLKCHIKAANTLIINNIDDYNKVVNALYNEKTPPASLKLLSSETNYIQ